MPKTLPTIRVGAAHFDGSRTWIMGVLNVTPDSFSDGGRFLHADDARRRAEQLVADGADLLDVGAESTRPGAAPIDAETEWARLGPVLAGIAHLPVPISVDTYKADVAARALDAGASIVNDVSGGGLDPRMFETCARAGAPLVISHLRGDPRTMQDRIDFADALGEVGRELEGAIGRARAAGVEQIIADPGIGFGKHLDHNLTLLAHAGALGARLGVPVLVGPSRKGFLGLLTGLPVEERAAATLGAVVAAACRGARFVRVHDVAEARRALLVADAILRAAGERDPIPAPGGERAGEGRP